MWCYRSVFIQLSRSWEGKQLFFLQKIFLGKSTVWKMSCIVVTPCIFLSKISQNFMFLQYAWSKRFEVTSDSGRLCQAFMDNSGWISWSDSHSFNPWISRSESNSGRHDIRLCYFCICCTLCENRKNFLPVCRKSLYLGNLSGSLCVYPRSLSHNDESRRARNLQVSLKFILECSPVRILYKTFSLTPTLAAGLCDDHRL